MGASPRVLGLALVVAACGGFAHAQNIDWDGRGGGDNISFTFGGFSSGPPDVPPPVNPQTTYKSITPPSSSYTYDDDDDDDGYDSYSSGTYSAASEAGRAIGEGMANIFMDLLGIGPRAEAARAAREAARQAALQAARIEAARRWELEKDAYLARMAQQSKRRMDTTNLVQRFLGDGRGVQILPYGSVTEVDLRPLTVADARAKFFSEEQLRLELQSTYTIANANLGPVGRIVPGDATIRKIEPHTELRQPPTTPPKIPTPPYPRLETPEWMRPKDQAEIRKAGLDATLGPGVAQSLADPEGAAKAASLVAAAPMETHDSASLPAAVPAGPAEPQPGPLVATGPSPADGSGTPGPGPAGPGPGPDPGEPAGGLQFAGLTPFPEGARPPGDLGPGRPAGAPAGPGGTRAIDQLQGLADRGGGEGGALTGVDTAGGGQFRGDKPVPPVVGVPVTGVPVAGVPSGGPAPEPGPAFPPPPGPGPGTVQRPPRDTPRPPEPPPPRPGSRPQPPPKPDTPGPLPTPKPRPDKPPPPPTPKPEPKICDMSFDALEAGGAPCPP